MSKQRTIVVIGAGIIGLTTAIRLLATLDPSQYRIAIVAQEWPTSIPGAPVEHSVNYASMWAGAHVRPIPASTPQLKREAAWLKHTVGVFHEQVEKSSMIGVTKCKGIELLEAPPGEYAAQTKQSFTTESGLPHYRRLDDSELSEGVKIGYEYETYCLHAPVYCASLLRSFILRGGQCLQRQLSNVWEAYSLLEDVALVVNASGTGFGDPKYFPTRGQTVLTDLNGVSDTVTLQKADGSWSFFIPRFFDGGTIIGGTKQPGDWSSTPDLATRQTLLNTASKIAPYALPASQTVQDARVIADIVGRRPTREGGMRIEVEHAMVGTSGHSRAEQVVHAYGAGGRGFEISWGVAAEVANLAKDALTTEKPEAVRAKL